MSCSCRSCRIHFNKNTDFSFTMNISMNNAVASKVILLRATNNNILADFCNCIFKMIFNFQRRIFMERLSKDIVNTFCMSYVLSHLSYEIFEAVIS